MVHGKSEQIYFCCSTGIKKVINDLDPFVKPASLQRIEDTLQALKIGSIPVDRELKYESKFT
jgi:hypothetical protein